MFSLSKILKIFIFSLVIIFLFSSVYLLFNNKEKLTRNLHSQFLVIKSGSMIPKLNINDIVIIKKYNDYKVDDIITYNYQDKYLITHRIIEKNESGFITKGDNNNSEDIDPLVLE